MPLTKVPGPATRRTPPRRTPPPPSRRTRPTGQDREPDPRLSDRERQLLALVAEGLTDAQIARRLGISPATASRQLLRIYQRHDLTNRAAAAGLCLRAA